MADSIVSLTYGPLLQVIQTIDIGIDGAVNRQAILEIADIAGVLAGDGTTWPISKAWQDQRTVAGTTETLDLTALARANLPTVDFTGLRLKFVVILAAAGQANTMTFQTGTSNGYPLFGATALGLGVPLLGGDVYYYATNNTATLPVVSATAKDILVTTTAGYIYTILLVAG